MKPHKNTSGWAKIPNKQDRWNHKQTPAGKDCHPPHKSTLNITGCSWCSARFWRWVRGVSLGLSQYLHTVKKRLGVWYPQCSLKVPKPHYPNIIKYFFTKTFRTPVRFSTNTVSLPTNLIWTWQDAGDVPHLFGAEWGEFHWDWANTYNPSRRGWEF